MYIPKILGIYILYILKDKFLYSDKFYYSRALNKETPFKLYDATYDDKIGLKLNNDSEY